MHFTIKKATRSKSLLLFADTRGKGATGLGPSAPGASAAYVREGASAAVAVPLVAGRLGGHTPGALVEVDPESMPGAYQYDVPDAMLAEGADSAILMLCFEGARVEPVQVSLVAYDAQDTNRLGLDALGPGGRIAALRGAFPRLTARELAETEGGFSKP